MNLSDAEKQKWQADLQLLLDAAQAAGAAAMSFFGKDPDVWWKNEGQSPVSAADYAANDILHERLRSARPDYGWLSEETDDDRARLDHETLFVVDPIDGTRAFVAGRAVWCVSVAVVCQGRPTAGVLVAPALDEVFSASKGGVALKNGRLLKCMESPARPCLIAASAGDFNRLPEDYRVKAERSAHVPSLAYRLAMVADGRLHGTLVKPSSHDWDLAAADLILEMAGGKLCDSTGTAPVYNKSDVKHGFLAAACHSEISRLQTALAAAENH